MTSAGRKFGRWFYDDRYARVRRTIAYLAVAAVFGVVIWRVGENYQADIERAKDLRMQLAEDLAYVTCTDRQAGRDVLRQVIVTATSSGDYEAVPSFADLDIETQTFFRDLRGDGTLGLALRERLLSEAPPIKCPPKPPGFIPVD